MKHEIEEIRDASDGEIEPSSGASVHHASNRDGADAMSDRVSRMGTASIPKLAVEFAVPAILGMVVNGAYNLIDSVFLGHGAGEIGLSAITVASPTMTIFLALAMYRHRRQCVVRAAPRRGQARRSRAHPRQHGYDGRAGQCGAGRAGTHSLRSRTCSLPVFGDRNSAPLCTRIHPDYQPGLRFPDRRHGLEQLHPYCGRAEPRAGHHADRRYRLHAGVQRHFRFVVGLGSRRQRVGHGIRPGYQLRDGHLVLRQDSGRSAAPASLLFPIKAKLARGILALGARHRSPFRPPAPW